MTYCKKGTKGGTAVRTVGSSDRARQLRRAALVGVTLFLLCVVQTTVLGRWQLFGAVPDLMLCAVVLLGYCRGREEGALGGIAAGVFVAALGSVGLTVAPVFYLLVGYVCGFFARAVYPKRFLPYLFFLGAALPFAAVKLLIQACLTYPNPRPAMLLLYAVLPELGGTFLCGAALFCPLRWLLGRK